MKKAIHSSFWLSDSPPFQNFRSSPVLPSSANVVIIGGGFSGVSTAYWLRKNGIEDIVILEQRGISGGATGRNGGHCWPVPHVPPEKFIAKYGANEINEIRKFDLENLRLLREFLASDPTFTDKVEFYTTGGVDIVPKSRSETNSDALIMRDDYDALMATKIEQMNMYWWDEDMCKQEMGEDTQFCCGIGQEKATQLWPAKLVFAILGKTLEMGSVQVYTQTKVTSEQSVEGGYSVKYKMERKGEEEQDGQTEGEIRCNVVVYAVNAWIPTLIPELKPVITPVRGQVVVTSPVNQPLVKSGHSLGLGFEISDHGGNKRGLEEESDSDDEESDIEDDGDDDLFYLLRRKKDNRIVAGTRVPRRKGATENELYDDSQPHDNITREVEEFLESFPSLKRKEDGSREWEVEYVWQGVMGFTVDCLPLVGPLTKREENEGEEEKGEKGEEKGGEKREGRYILGGFNGDGMPKCFGSGKAVADMIAGKLQAKDFMPSFSPSRFY